MVVGGREANAANLPDCSAPISQAAAATMLNVSERSVATAAADVARNESAWPSIESPRAITRTSTGSESRNPPQALNFSPPPDSLENGFYPDEIETRVGRESDQKRRRRSFFHDVHEAFLSKQIALESSKTGPQPRQRV
jgi:hypothetical protein